MTKFSAFIYYENLTQAQVFICLWKQSLSLAYDKRRINQLPFISVFIETWAKPSFLKLSFLFGFAGWD